jgi:beta-phosphoglucomutase-like phosphatase (HAD superfamily)
MIKMNNAFEQLPGFRDMFDGLITGDMVKNCKPDPEGYLMAADMLGLKPENCYVFEDSLQGIQAGINAGCKVVALTTTVARERIEELEANKIMDSFNGFGVDEMLAL